MCCCALVLLFLFICVLLFIAVFLPSVGHSLYLSLCIDHHYSTILYLFATSKNCLELHRKFPLVSHKAFSDHAKYCLQLTPLVCVFEGDGSKSRHFPACHCLVCGGCEAQTDRYPWLRRLATGQPQPKAYVSADHDSSGEYFIGEKILLEG